MTTCKTFLLDECPSRYQQ